MKCLNCSHEMKKKVIDHIYVDCGLRNVILKKIDTYTCKHCDEEEIVIPNLEQLHQVLAHTISSQAKKLLPEEIRFLRSYLGLSGVDFAKTIGVKPETVSRWENGKQSIDLSNERLLRLMILSKFGPFRDYQELSLYGSEKAKKLTTRTFVSRNNEWREAA